MILRGSSDIVGLLETIEESGFLGELIQKAFDEWASETEMTNFAINTREMEAPPLLPSAFGFWLPHGLQTTDGNEFATRYHTFVNQFNRIETAFKSYFQVSDEDIWLESQSIPSEATWSQIQRLLDPAKF